MKFGGLSWLAMALLLTLAIAACGGGADEPAGNGEPAPAEEVESPVDPATAATISGSVLFTGDAPDPEPILMDAEPVCQNEYPEGAFTETVVVNDNGTLRNVFVYVKDGLGV